MRDVQSKGGAEAAIAESKAMGKIDMGAVVKGAAAMVLIAAATYVFAQALMVFAGNPKLWESLGAAIIGMFAMVGALAVLGTFVTSGYGAVALILGAAALVVLSSALWVFGKALQEIGKGLVIMGQFINSLSNWDFASMAGLAGGLTLLAGAFGLITLSAIGMAVALPVIIGFAGAVFILGAGLKLMAMGLTEITSSLMQLSSISSQLAIIGQGFAEIGKGLFIMAGGLAVITPFLPAVAALGLVNNTVGTTPTVTASSQNASNADVIKKLDEVIAAINTGHIIEIDGVKINRQLTTSTPAKGTNTAYTSGKGIY